MRVLSLSIGVAVFFFACGAARVRAGFSPVARPSAGMQASDEARRITPEEVRVALQKRQAILIDVRSEETYKSGHIRGARSIPWNQIATRANELPRNKMIVTYCT